jgi:hypothetical protein
METRKLAALLVTVLNAAAEQIEEAMSEDAGDGKEGKGGKDKEEKAGGKRRRNDKQVDDPSEDDIVDAVRGAQKVLESNDVKKILKKHGKAERASEVEPENRQAVIDALEKAVEDAD